MNDRSSWVRLGSAFFVLSFLCAEALAQHQAVSYYNDIRPIIQRSCQGCHQPASKMGGLALTDYELIRQGGQKGPVLREGAPDDSPLIAHLTGKAEPRMPMGLDPLPNDEIDLLRRWIAEGARDDTPASARGPRIPEKPPVYHQPPVITAAAYSPGGELLAVGGYHEILLHKADGSKIEARLLGKSARIHSLMFTPGGETLVAVGGTPAQFGEVQIWDVKKRELLRSVTATSDTLFGGSLSPDGGRVVFGGTDKTVRVVEIATGRELFKAGHHEDWVLGAVFGIDGKRIVSAGRDRAAKLADAATGAFIENVNLLRDELSAIARHPRRDYVLIGGKDRVPYLYRMDRPRALKIADDSTLVRKFEEQKGEIFALAFNSDGSRIAVGGMSGEATIYDTETGDRVATCELPQGAVFTLSFRPDGKQLLTGGFDGRLRLCDASSGKRLKEFLPAPLDGKLVSKK